MIPQDIRETSQGLPVMFLLLLSLIATCIAVGCVLLARRRIEKLTEMDEVFDHASLQRARLLYENSVSAMVVTTCVTVVIVTLLMLQGETLGPRLSPFEILRNMDDD
jgi:hypothetical protein